LNELTIFNYLIPGWLLLAAFTFISLFFFTAPYGRHTRNNWGLTIANKKGWIIMESTAPIIFAVCFIMGNNPVTATTLVFFIMWEAHYIHRAFIYPSSLRGHARRIPLAIMASGLIFNAVNGYLNGRYIYTLSDGYASDWLLDIRFISGLFIFVLGFIINRRADLMLRQLRQPGKSDYKVPYREMYRFVSCPNYLGEILIWVGWAIATWSLPGLTFAVWTIANLVPRAKAHHAWYHRHFSDYPPERKALVPWLW